MIGYKTDAKNYAEIDSGCRDASNYLRMQSKCTECPFKRCLMELSRKEKNKYMKMAR